MKKIVVMALAMLLCVPMFAGAKKKADKDTEAYRYELECAGNGVAGTYLVKVWSYSKKAKVAAEQAKKNAVHGIIFKGFTGGNGCASQRPLAKDAGVELEHQDYFDKFFEDNGEYLKFVSLTSTAQEVVKVGKEYKVGVVVSIRKEDLRKTLEAAGVIRGLSSGF